MPDQVPIGRRDTIARQGPAVRRWCRLRSVLHASARPRRRVLAAAAGTALVLCLAPLGSVAAQAAPAAAGSAAPIVAAHPRHLQGERNDLTYDVAVPVFSGTAASAAINRRVLTSARDVIAGAAEPIDGGAAHHTLDGASAVTTNDGRTVQVVTEYDDYYDGAAHPTDTVRATAVVARTGAPITLATLFPHRKAALKVLAREVERAAAKADEPITEHDGLAPTTANWAAWQSTRKGFEVHFQDYQLGGHGLRVYTLPWKAVKPLLSATAKALLAPR